MPFYLVHKYRTMPPAFTFAIIFGVVRIIRAHLIFVDNVKRVNRGLSPIRQIRTPAYGEVYKGERALHKMCAILGLIMLALGLWSFAMAMMDTTHLFQEFDEDTCSSIIYAMVSISSIACLVVDQIFIETQTSQAGIRPIVKRFL